MVRVLIAYASRGGNTQEVAELIEQEIIKAGHEVVKHRIGIGEFPLVSSYDKFLLGTFTSGKGATPPVMKDFVYELGYKPKQVIIFGTGDTQYGGDELFCNATEKLATFYSSTLPILKIEQSPRGTQEIKVVEWTEGVMGKW
jgi:predicted ribonucleotide reductase-associated flavodoxin